MMRRSALSSSLEHSNQTSSSFSVPSKKYSDSIPCPPISYNCSNTNNTNHNQQTHLLPQQLLTHCHSVGIYSETTHNLATVVSARPAPAACFYNPRMSIRACAVQYAFDAFINSEFGSRLKWQVWQLANYQLSACVLK